MSTQTLQKISCRWRGWPTYCCCSRCRHFSRSDMPGWTAPVIWITPRDQLLCFSQSLWWVWTLRSLPVWAPRPASLLCFLFVFSITDYSFLFSTERQENGVIREGNTVIIIDINFLLVASLSLRTLGALSIVAPRSVAYWYMFPILFLRYL